MLRIRRLALRHTLSVLAASAALVLCAGTASAKDAPQKQQAEAFRALVTCRDIADSAARLACYDKQVSALAQAEKAGDLVVADRETMRETRRGLFGFRLPSLGIFGGGEDKETAPEEDITEITAELGSARQIAYGAWRLTLKDGAVWEQTDGEKLVLDPRPGDTVVIKRAALGNFKARIGKQPPVKVRRVE